MAVQTQYFYQNDTSSDIVVPAGYSFKINKLFIVGEGGRAGATYVQNQYNGSGGNGGSGAGAVYLSSLFFGKSDSDRTLALAQQSGSASVSWESVLLASAPKGNHNDSYNNTVNGSTGVLNFTPSDYGGSGQVFTGGIGGATPSGYYTAPQDGGEGYDISGIFPNGLMDASGVIHTIIGSGGGGGRWPKVPYLTPSLYNTSGGTGASGGGVYFAVGAEEPGRDPSMPTGPGCGCGGAGRNSYIPNGASGLIYIEYELVLSAEDADADSQTDFNAVINGQNFRILQEPDTVASLTAQTENIAELNLPANTDAFTLTAFYSGEPHLSQDVFFSSGSLSNYSPTYLIDPDIISGADTVSPGSGIELLEPNYLNSQLFPSIHPYEPVGNVLVIDIYFSENTYIDQGDIIITSACSIYSLERTGVTGEFKYTIVLNITPDLPQGAYYFFALNNATISAVSGKTLPGLIAFKAGVGALSGLYPLIEIETLDGTGSIYSPTDIIITFPSGVTGFTLADISKSYTAINNYPSVEGTFSNFRAISNSVYRVLYTPGGRSLLVLKIQIAADSYSYIDYPDVPGRYAEIAVGINTLQGILSTEGWDEFTSISYPNVTKRITLNLKQPESDFNLLDFTSPNATLSNFEKVSDTVYKFDITVQNSVFIPNNYIDVDLAYYGSVVTSRRIYYNIYTIENIGLIVRNPNSGKYLIHTSLTTWTLLEYGSLGSNSSVSGSFIGSGYSELKVLQGFSNTPFVIDNQAATVTISGMDYTISTGNSPIVYSLVGR